MYSQRRARTPHPSVLESGTRCLDEEKLLGGHTVGSRTYKVHLDGYDQTALLSGRGPSERKEFFYFSDDGDLLAMRYDKYKVHFMIQEAEGMEVWRKPFTKLRGPILFDLRSDPGERGMSSAGWQKWSDDHAYFAVPLQGIVGKFLASFKEFPPRQKPGSFTVQQANDALSAPKSKP